MPILILADGINSFNQSPTTPVAVATFINNHSSVGQFNLLFKNSQAHFAPSLALSI